MRSAARAAPHPPQDLDLASAAFARLRELEQRGLPDAADLAAGFADLYADHGVASTVEIMTIHKAKGLEFDMVVLPALDRAVPGSRNQLLAVHQFARAGRDGMVMAARPGVGAEDRLFEFLRHQLRDAAALEAERLLYVACTRAKWQLRLTATIERRPAAEGGKLAGRAVAGGGCRICGAEVIAGAQRRRRAARRPAAARAPGLGAELDAGVVGGSADVGAAVAAHETPVFDWAGETARRVGSLVHAELQSMNIGEHRRRRRSARGNLIFGAGWPCTACRRSACRRPPRGSWRLWSRCSPIRAAGGFCRRRARTCASTRSRAGCTGEVARVVFDRSFIDDQGVRWVIDYKTSRHIGGGLEEFLDREVERYRPQLQRYALLAQRLGPEPVRLGLYFPLMRAWREWAA